MFVCSCFTSFSVAVISRAFEPYILDTANVETKFVEDAVHQLLKARHVLKCSYVYGYYLEETGYKKPIFEFMQVSNVTSFYVEIHSLSARGL